MELRNLVPSSLRCRIADWRGRGIYSQYADAHQCIFIHVPKAAGTSVALTLFGQKSRHIPWFEYYRANPDKFRRYFKFSFVRNPWDRLVSTYFFLQRGGMNAQDAAWAAENLGSYPSFERFVLAWLNENTIHTWVHFRPQHYFICDDSGKVMLDFVGRVENMREDFAIVAARLGCNHSLEKVNVGSQQHYSHYYTDEARELVGRVYAKDISLFGYHFENVADGGRAC